jgi:hypothetical protein
VTFIVYNKSKNITYITFCTKNPIKKGTIKMSFKNPNKLKKSKKIIKKVTIKPAITQTGHGKIIK